MVEVQERPQRAVSRKSSRSKLEVYSDILKAAGSGAESPTQIMLKANVSWNVLKDSLQVLIAHGLIIELLENEKPAYRLTNRGFQLLEKLMAIREQISSSVVV